MTTDARSNGCACRLTGPPPGGPLDRLARWLEGGARGADTRTLVDLAAVLPAPALQRLDQQVVAFYRAPLDFALRTGVAMGRWSRLIMWLFAALMRQSRVPDRDAGFEAYEVCQHLYRDRRGRLHWDRYARVDRTLQRLFIARIDTARGRICETFVFYGVPVRLAFAVEVDGGALRLTLVRRESSLLAWPARVSYRTARLDPGEGLATEGDFRAPLIGLRVRMQYRMHPATSASIHR